MNIKVHQDGTNKGHGIEIKTTNKELNTCVINDVKEAIPLELYVTYGWYTEKKEKE